PDLASAASRADLAQFRDRFFSGLRMMTVVILPAAAAYVILARPIVAFLLERGAFSGSNGDLTADCLKGFAVGLVPFSLYLFALRGFYAFRDTRTPFFLNCLENAFNIILALALEPWLGTKGLAYAYSGAYLLAAAVALRALERRSGAFGTAALRWRRMVVRMLVAAVLLAVVAGAVLALLPDGLPSPIKIAAGSLAGLAVYIPALRMMRVREAVELVKRLRP
ncbi:MAG: lipid II flippase MurJ, partial [Gemmatimonadales bacterium]